MPSALQVVEAKEAGAAGVLGAIANVCGPRGAPVLSSYAAAIGLDCPVEVTCSECLSTYTRLSAEHPWTWDALVMQEHINCLSELLVASLL